MLLLNHLVALRSHTDFKNSRVVFIPESNLACDGHRLAKLVEQSGMKRITIMKEDDDRAGIRVDAKLKDRMATELKSKLQEGCMYIHEDFIVTAEGCTRESVLSDMTDHMTSFSRITLQGSAWYIKPRVYYSGKHGPGDDLVIGLQLNLIAMRYFYDADKYKPDW